MQLEKERPDLLKKVVRGELSANKAFLEAGIQSPRIQATAQTALMTCPLQIISLFVNRSYSH